MLHTKLLDAALDPPPQAETLTAALELRVLAGAAKGAQAELQARRAVDIGHAFANDLVVRDPGAKGVRLRLTPGMDVADLQVLEGEVELLGHRIAAPAAAILPAYVPLLVGSSALAYGEAGGARWPEALRLLLAARPDLADAPPEGPRKGAPPMAWKVLTGWWARNPAPGLAAIAAVMLLGLALSALSTPMIAPLWDRSPTPERAAAELRKAGFHTVTVERSGDGGLTAAGIVPREADRARLEAVVQRKNWPITVNVQTGDSIAREVEDVYRTHGYTAAARPGGLGVVGLQVSGGDAAGLEDVRRQALHDVKGLKILAVSSQGGTSLGDSAAADAPPDPGKRVTAVVAGDGAYVATEDGSRYFLGAILPSGHQIVSIQDRDVGVQKDGVVTHLKF